MLCALPVRALLVRREAIGSERSGAPRDNSQQPKQPWPAYRITLPDIFTLRRDSVEQGGEGKAVLQEQLYAHQYPPNLYGPELSRSRLLWTRSDRQPHLVHRSCQRQNCLRPRLPDAKCQDPQGKRGGCAI